MSDLEPMLVAGVLIPLVGFVFLAFFGARLGKPAAGWFASACIAASGVLATVVLIRWYGMDGAARIAAIEAARAGATTWAYLGSVPLTIGVNLDGLTVIMFFMVTFVSTCIFVFSIGYMAGHSDEIDGQSKYHRFFTYLCLFGFSMLGLVIADSLLFLFIFWELVGLCSYLLIGFYFHKQSASNAAIKAFVTNRVGDVGFLLGLAMVFLYLKDLSLIGAADAFRTQYEHGGSPLFEQMLLGAPLATWMGVLLFCGAIGKSAQFPLHVWLPDAMEGPTPVSALIHAATMVAAGVYLVARIFVLLTPGAQFVVAVIGCITLTLAALVAIVQTDIKKVLAYSTISQLGYMILGMGVGAWIGALFHLLTHAFFKALMFLGSGQVIEGCHHEQDIRRMGGLRHKMPVTCWTFLVGVLAIAGVGIPMTGVGIGGFFSKDEILAVAWHRAYGHGHAGMPGWLFWIPIVIACVTPFYMMRCWWLTFMGKPRDHHVHESAHESKLMYVPLMVLAVGTLVSGPMLFRGFVADAVPAPFISTVYDAGLEEHATQDRGAQDRGTQDRGTQNRDNQDRGNLLLASGEPRTSSFGPGEEPRTSSLGPAEEPRTSSFGPGEEPRTSSFGPGEEPRTSSFGPGEEPRTSSLGPAEESQTNSPGHGTEGHVAVAGIDHRAHTVLAPLATATFLIGFGVAIALYRRGLGTADALARRFAFVHSLLVRKFYFDEIYNFIFIGGVHFLKDLFGLLDQIVVDGLVNLTARITEGLSRFSGNVLDARGVDGAVNGVGDGVWRLGDVARAAQVGRIRSYILFAVCGAAVIVLLLVSPRF